MKCTKLRRLLADSGPAGLSGNREAEDHLVDCSDCYAVLEAMTEIDGMLPGLESLDVADEVVEQLLARTELQETPAAGVAETKGRLARLRTRINSLSPLPAVKRLGSIFDRARQARLRWGIVAVPAVILVGIVSILTIRSVHGPLTLEVPTKVQKAKNEDSLADSSERENQEEWEEQDPQSRVAGTVGAAGVGRSDGEGSSSPLVADQIVPEEASKTAAKRVMAPGPTSDLPDSGKEMNGVPSESDSVVVLNERAALGYPGAPVSTGGDDVTVTGGEIPRIELQTVGEIEIAQTPPVEEAGRDRDATSKNEEVPVAPGSDKLRLQNYPLVGDEDAGRRSEDARHGNKKPNQEANESKKDQNYYRQESAQIQDFEHSGEGSFSDAKDRSLLAELVTEIDDEALSAAHRFLAERNRVEDLTFREARGYWANTYVPGDRTLRLLKARLDRAAGNGAFGSMHEGAQQISQPFDSPDGAALAVYLHGDRLGVETRERMLVQIGLKGTERRSGMRPAMNVGLVLDLRGEVTTDAATSIRALLQAFAASAELGDRFSLTVAGRPGGTVVQPGDLRHGPLTVAMAELFGEDASGEILSLEQAVAAAQKIVRAEDDPNAPLGSSALIVITSQPFAALTGRLTDMAHASAVDGVPWSAIGIGSGVGLAELDALVLAGQGNRRLLTTPADAEALVDRELAAVSRVVARAVRLRIRLAPGVQLVDVIGSERLDERRAQKVRDAEQSIDQRLSRNLGIQTDRGLDEEAIQIVIPSYYADDAHVVLLDVVVPGPGPVADVTVRYKDLVHMKNGVARAHLEVGRSGSTLGPLEQNVLANLVATEVASDLDDAADAVAMGDLDTADAILTESLDLVRGITGLVDGLAQDPDLESDIQMLVGYLEALATLSVNDPAQLQTAADSLRYAGRLKVLPPPVDDEIE